MTVIHISYLSNINLNGNKQLLHPHIRDISLHKCLFWMNYSHFSNQAEVWYTWQWHWGDYLIQRPVFNFLNDFWVGDKPIRNLISGPMREDVCNLSIADLWNPVFGWNMDICSFDIPRSISSLIMATPLQLWKNEPDLFIWKNSSSTWCFLYQGCMPCCYLIPQTMC